MLKMSEAMLECIIRYDDCQFSEDWEISGRPHSYLLRVTVLAQQSYRCREISDRDGNPEFAFAANTFIEQQAIQLSSQRCPRR